MPVDPTILETLRRRIASAPGPAIRLRILTEYEYAVATLRREVIVDWMLDDRLLCPPNWASLGHELGTSRQAARQTWGPIVTAEAQRRTHHNEATP